MNAPTVTLILVVALALAFAFLNGFNVAGGIIATIISSRVMAPRKALILIAVSEFCGPLLLGVAVAKTIASGIVSPSQVTLPVILAALAGTLLWGGITWFLGIPISSSHALIGGLLGAVGASVGFQAINFSGLLSILIVLFSSPIIGLIVGYLMMKAIYRLSRRASMKVNWFFKNGQIFTGIILGLSLGANDAQKSIGLITMALMIAGWFTEFQVPLWVILICAAAMAAGVLGGGYRLIRTLGGKLYKIRPEHGFAAQFSAALVMLTAVSMGGPVSTTQVTSSAILGAGSADRMNKVRWGVAGNIAMSWLLTIPFAALLSALLYLLISLVI